MTFYATCFTAHASVLCEVTRLLLRKCCVCLCARGRGGKAILTDIEKKFE